MKTRLPLSNKIAQAEELIHLTPLIDVVFIVLIVFISISPFYATDSIKLAPSSPEKTASSFEENHSLKIYVDERGIVQIDGIEVALPHLSSLLKPRQEKIASLYYDEAAPFGVYQRIKNVLEKEGYEQLIIVLDPPE